MENLSVELKENIADTYFALGRGTIHTVADRLILKNQVTIMKTLIEILQKPS